MPSAWGSLYLPRGNPHSGQDKKSQAGGEAAYNRSTGKLPSCAVLDQYHDACVWDDNVFALQDIVKTTKYRKRCFDQIEPTFKENQELTAEVDSTTTTTT
jgi:hypothetical protein